MIVLVSLITHAALWFLSYYLGRKDEGDYWRKWICINRNQTGKELAKRVRECHGRHLK